MASLSSLYACSSVCQRQPPSPSHFSPYTYSRTRRLSLLPFISPPAPAFFSASTNLQFCSSAATICPQCSLVSRRIRYFRASSSGPPSPPSPPSDPSPRKIEDISAALLRVQDTARIFLAVFLWMALFFWASAWDGRNGGGGRNKGSRFKR